MSLRDQVVQPPLSWVPFLYISACAVVRLKSSPRQVIWEVVNHYFSRQVVHAIFKHYEPSRLALHGLFILVLPISLSTLLIPHLSVIKAVAATAAVYHVSLLTSIALYRLSPFHPYARYDGPVACKLSKIWLAWVSSYGKQHTYIQSLHRQYGDVVRIGTRRFCIVARATSLIVCQGRTKFPSEMPRS